MTKVVGSIKDVLLSFNFPADELRVIKNNQKKVLEGLKKNRSTTIKTRFEKQMMKPIYETVANIDLKVTKEMKQTKLDLTRTIDMKNDESAKQFTKILDKTTVNLEGLMNELNEQVRKKLKFAVEAVSRFILKRQNININLSKHEK